MYPQHIFTLSTFWSAIISEIAWPLRVICISTINFLSLTKNHPVIKRKFPDFCVWFLCHFSLVLSVKLSFLIKTLKRFTQLTILTLVCKLNCIMVDCKWGSVYVRVRESLNSMQAGDEMMHFQFSANLFKVLVFT